ncbi:MAG: MFS transporter [Planctomycetota bacterium]
MTTSPLSALRERNFATFLASRFLATVAVQMQTVAVGWQVYAISNDPLDLGLIGLSQFVPFLLLVLVAGQAADSYQRRRILALCYGVQALCAVLLLAFTLARLDVVWPVFTIMVLFGASRAFTMTAGQAMLPNLVPAASFRHAVAINSSSFQIATVAGPTLGGLVYLAGANTVYATVTVLLITSVALMRTVRSRPSAAAREPFTWSTLLSGLRYVRAKPIVLGAISLDLFAVLFGGATALLPAYARDILHTGPECLGLLRSAPGVGAALTGMYLTFQPVQRRVGLILFGGVALFGACTIVFGLSTWFWLSLAALTLLGAADMLSVYVRHVLVQLATPDAIRGRVSAVNAVFIGTSNELGEFESGVTAAWFGLVPAVVIGGAATIVVAALWAYLFPALRLVDRLPAAADESGA